MLSLFPDLFTYQEIAPFILRISLGFVALNLGYLKLTHERARFETSLAILRLKPVHAWVTGLGISQIAGGILLIVGLFTQGAALVCAIIFCAESYFEAKEDLIFTRNFAFYLLLAAMSAALLFTGPGWYSIDLPL